MTALKIFKISYWIALNFPLRIGNVLDEGERWRHAVKRGVVTYMAVEFGRSIGVDTLGLITITKLNAIKRNKDWSIHFIFCTSRLQIHEK